MHIQLEPRSEAAYLTALKLKRDVAPLQQRVTALKALNGTEFDSESQRDTEVRYQDERVTWSRAQTVYDAPDGRQLVSQGTGVELRSGDDFVGLREDVPLEHETDTGDTSCDVLTQQQSLGDGVVLTQTTRLGHQSDEVLDYLIALTDRSSGTTHVFKSDDREEGQRQCESKWGELMALDGSAVDQNEDAGGVYIEEPAMRAALSEEGSSRSLGSFEWTSLESGREKESLYRIVDAGGDSFSLTKGVSLGAQDHLIQRKFVEELGEFEDFIFIDPIK